MDLELDPKFGTITFAIFVADAFVTNMNLFSSHGLRFVVLLGCCLTRSVVLCQNDDGVDVVGGGNDNDANIVGGRPAPLGAYPFYAIPNGLFLCGATLIHADILITAAHCNMQVSFLTGGRIGLGGSVFIGPNLSDGSDSSESIRVELIRRHPEFDPVTLKNDLVLIKLKSPSSAPVALWNQDPKVPAAAANVTAIGFGTTFSGGGISPNLLDVTLRITDFNNCSKAYGGLDRETMICAAARGKDTCQGDSGGPLLSGDGKTIVGVVSFGYGCADPRFPGVYASVASARDFIRAGICEMSDSPPADCDLLQGETKSGLCDTCGTGLLPTGTRLKRKNLFGNCNEICVNVGVLIYQLLGWECGSC